MSGAQPAANADMVRAWDGDEGSTWTAWEDHFNRAVARFDVHLMTAASIAPSDVVLDIGCGTGQTTRAAARLASSGRALGVDLSEQMLARARERAASEGLDNAEFVRADAQTHAFDRGVHDLAISRFGVMFFDDPTAAFANVASALRPGGRLTMLAWQPLAQNAWVGVVRDSLAAGRDLPAPPVGRPGPFGLADPDQATGVLLAAGLDDVTVEPVREPIWYGDDPDSATAYVRSTGVARGLLADLDDATAAASLDRLHAAMVAAHGSSGVCFDGAAWLISCTAT